MNTKKNLHVALFLICLLIILTSLAGCLPRRTENPYVGQTRTQQLPMGISIAAPVNWQITTTSSASDADILATVGKKERTVLLDMQFSNPGETNVSARAFLQIVNSEQDFMPLTSAQNMSAEDFTLMGQTIMQLDADLAQRNQQTSRLLEWQVKPTQVSGMFAVQQAGLGTRGQSSVRTLYLDVYLPNSVGLVVRLLADTQLENAEQILQALTNSISINPR